MAEFETESVEHPLYPAPQGSGVPDDGADGRLLVAELAADDGGESFSYEIVGEGADIFEMTGDVLYVRKGAEDAFRAVPEHRLILRITDITGEVFDEPISIDVASVAEPDAEDAETDDAPESDGIDGEPEPEPVASDPFTPDPFAIAEQAASDALAAFSEPGAGEEDGPAGAVAVGDADHLPLEPETARVELVAVDDDGTGEEVEIPGPTAVLESDPDAEQAALVAEIDAAELDAADAPATEILEAPVPVAEPFYGADGESEREAEDAPDDALLHGDPNREDAGEETAAEEAAFDERQSDLVSASEDDGGSEEPAFDDDVAEAEGVTEEPFLADEGLGEPSEVLAEGAFSEEAISEQDVALGAEEPVAPDDGISRSEEPSDASADAADLVRVIEEADPDVERPVDDIPYAAFADVARAEAEPVVDEAIEAREEEEPAGYEEPVTYADEEAEHEFGKYYFYLGPDGHFVIGELDDDAPELANGVADVTLVPHYADPEPDLFGDRNERASAPAVEEPLPDEPPAPVLSEPEAPAFDPLETPAAEPAATPADEPASFDAASADEAPADEPLETPAEPVEGAMRYEVDDDRFFVDEEGNVMLADGAAFDADAEPSVDLEVTARAPDGSVSRQTFTIDVSEFV
ncbi:hypothetical protein [Rhodobium gokarnense]|uniref:Cadherin domain-containing protein n=1 Tax=Rhodobium gokarnense TaxID=364296 RepID=A0ABT3HCC2_9HYPH|nr:hypothetical protein [Rhodobium gokarnense]MCW2308046.1 hypothetical protein [Rhodobium gokarnense]